MVSIVTVPECENIARSVHKIVSDAGHDVRNDVILVSTKLFADGNARPKITETVRRTEVYLFYCLPLGEPEKGMARLALILNALQLASTISITVIMSYFEGRQDRKDGKRTGITAKVAARIIEKEPKVEGLITFDLHSDQLVLAFDRIPVSNLWGQRILALHCKNENGPDANICVVSPDVGSIKRADKFSKNSGYPLFGTIVKERSRPNEVSAMRYIGDDFRGLNVILPDDLIDTGGTMIKAYELVMFLGAQSCTAYTTHWLASAKGEAGDPLRTAEAKFRNAHLKVVALDTIPRPVDYGNADVVEFVSSKYAIAQAIIQSITPAGSYAELSD